MKIKILSTFFVISSLWTTTKSAEENISPVPAPLFFYKPVSRKVIERTMGQAEGEENWALYLDNSDDVSVIPTSGICYSRKGTFQSHVCRKKAGNKKSSFVALLTEQQCYRLVAHSEEQTFRNILFLKIVLPIAELLNSSEFFSTHQQEEDFPVYQDSLTPGSLSLDRITALCEYDPATQQFVELTKVSPGNYQRKS
jgi:hypothetical protein